MESRAGENHRPPNFTLQKNEDPVLSLTHLIAHSINQIKSIKHPALIRLGVCFIARHKLNQSHPPAVSDGYQFRGVRGIV